MNDLPGIARRTTLILFLAYSLASAGFIAASTLNSILGARLGGGPAWSGVPSAVYLLGSAFAASAWGYIMDVIGRRNGIALGLAIGAGGTGLVIYSIDHGWLVGFLAGMVFMGIANAAIVLARYAAAEVNPPERRGEAISTVVLGGTFGSVVGPLVVGPAGAISRSLGMDELAGAYAVCMVLFALAALLVEITLRPDPRETGREVARLYPHANPDGEARAFLVILRQPQALAALASMVLGQVVMVGVMVITSLHMKDNHHMLTDIASVISAHTFGMYAFSLVSGWLVDHWGRAQVILTGAAVLLLSCVAAPLSPDVLPLAVALFLLGLGWNFCFVGGSTLLADQLSPAERARTQGNNDLLVGLASAVASLSAGIIFSALGYALVATAGAVLSLIPIFLALKLILGRNKTLDSTVIR